MEQLKVKILKVLGEDSRYTADKIATMLGEKTEAVKKAVSEMEHDGTIVKYSLLINDQKAGKDTVEALIEVKVSPMHTKGFDSIAEDISQFDEVKSLYLMSGAYDLAVFIEGKTLKEVASFVSEKLSVMDKVLSTATHFILKKYKLDGEPVEVSGSAKRLAVNP